MCVFVPRHPFHSAQTARFNRPTFLPLLQTMSLVFGRAGGAALTGSGSPYVRQHTTAPDPQNPPQDNNIHIACACALPFHKYNPNASLETCVCVCVCVCACARAVCVYAKAVIQSCSKSEVQHSYIPCKLQPTMCSVLCGHARVHACSMQSNSILFNQIMHRTARFNI